MMIFASTYSVEKAVVALESHKDGTPHIHLAVVLKDKQTKNIILKYMQKQYPEDYKRIDTRNEVMDRILPLFNIS